MITLKRNILYPITLGLAMLLSLGIAQAQESPLRLWYAQPARQWEETLPLGNGRLGMTPDGGVTNEKVVLNDITLWSGSVQDANNYEAYKSLPEIRALLNEGKNDQAQALIDKHFVCTGKGSGGVPFGCFQMLANLNLQYTYNDQDNDQVKFENYSRTLSLNNAIANCLFEVNGVQYKREYFTSFGSDVSIIRLTANKAAQINCKISMDRPERGTASIKDGILQFSGRLDNGTDGKGMQYQAKLKAVLKDGTLTQQGNTLVIKNATSVTLFISEQTDFKNPSFLQKVDQLLQQASVQSYADLRSRHIANFQKLFNRVTLQLPGSSKENMPTDQRLNEFQKDPDSDIALSSLFFQFGRYLSISSTRVGLLPPNLQGLWANEVHTPWNGDYHLDVNVEMNHWPVEVSNLSELDLPLAELVRNMVKNGEKTAKAYYNANGWVAHVITNVWGFTEPGESASWGVTKSGSGWLCNNLWEHYAFTDDKQYLASIYPILKGSAEFYKSILVKDPKTGWLVTSPSSPENSFYLPNGKTASICMGATIDNQIIRELFNHVITAASLLSKDAQFSKELQQTIQELPPAGRIAPDGRLMEWLEDYKETDVHHRHISHLYGLYPADLITPDKTPDLAAACKKTLNARGDDGPSWSIAYKMLFWARLYDGDRAYQLLKNILRPTLSTNINYGAGGGVYPNLFSAGPPFQIDANFGAEAGIAEMLLQSHAGYINLLPAIPEQWKTSGKVTGLKARGNYTVGFQWKNGHVTAYTISSPMGGKVKIKVNGQIKNVKVQKI